MVRAASLGLPMSLEAAGKVLALPISKDQAGKRLIRRLTIPRARTAAGCCLGMIRWRRWSSSPTTRRTWMWRSPSANASPSTPARDRVGNLRLGSAHQRHRSPHRPASRHPVPTDPHRPHPEPGVPLHRRRLLGDRDEGDRGRDGGRQTPVDLVGPSSWHPRTRSRRRRNTRTRSPSPRRIRSCCTRTICPRSGSWTPASGDASSSSRSRPRSRARRM